MLNRVNSGTRVLATSPFQTVDTIINYRGKFFCRFTVCDSLRAKLASEIICTNVMKAGVHKCSCFPMASISYLDYLLTRVLSNNNHL